MFPRRDRIQQANQRLNRLFNENWDIEIRSMYIAIDLLERCPNAARIRDKDGNLPLHKYCNLHKDQELTVVQALVEAYPESVRMTTSNGDTPLHLSCLLPWSQNVTVIRFLVDQYPDALFVKNRLGETPLQQVLSDSNLRMYYDNLGPQLLSLVAFMVNACPGSAKVLNYDHETLLHIISKNVHDNLASLNSHSFTEMLGILVEMFPEATNLADVEGRLPLHSLCSKCSRCLSVCPQYLQRFHQILKELLSISEGVMKFKDDKGQTPLHVLCSQGTPNDLIKVFLDKNPSLASERDKQGRTPLHCLVESFPEYHLCVLYYDDYSESVHSLIDAFPLGANARDNDGVTPLQFAHEKNLTLSMVYQLFRVDPLASLSSLGLR